MTTARPARHNEIPRFGSVWAWDLAGPIRYIALCVEGELLHSVMYTTMGTVVLDDGMTWRNENLVIPGWLCIDEGPE